MQMLMSFYNGSPGEVDSSVFQQVRSPGSIVQSLPANSPSQHAPRLPGGGSTNPTGGASGSGSSGSSSHQSPLFPPAGVTAVSRGEEFHLHGLSSDAIPRRLSRRQPPAPPVPPPRPSPAPEDEESAKEILAKTMAKVWFERNADKAYVLLKKEQLSARIKDLRKHLEYLDDTEWYYTPVDQLIGQY